MKPVSETAFYCCGARMLDAQSKKPIANDYMASRFMSEDGTTIFKRFRSELIANAACVMRHKIIDDMIGQQIEKNNSTTIIIIGAGFDTRAYRHAGGQWFEIDEYQLIDFKNKKLPISECSNPLHRYSVDFSSNELNERLQNIHTQTPVVFIIEGVFMYLNTQQIVQLLDTLSLHFPQHTIICDLLTKQFQQLFGQSIQRKIKAMGNQFITTTSPDILFHKHGYHLQQYTSIVEKTIESGALFAPKWLAKKLPTLVKMGYGIHHFVHTA